MDDYKIIVEQEHQTVMAHYEVEPKPAEGYQSEAALEKSLIKQLQGQGYEYAHIKDEAGLLKNLRHQLELLNEVVLSDLPLLPFPALPSGHRTGAREACRIVATSYSASMLFTISNIAVASSACASYLMNFPQKVKFSVFSFGGLVELSYLCT